MENRRSFGDILHEARNKANLSLRGAAKSIGISAVYLSELEADRKKPSNKMLENLIEFYSLDKDEVLRVLFIEEVEKDESRVIAARMVMEASPKRFDATKLVMELSEDDLDNLIAKLTKGI